MTNKIKTPEKIKKIINNLEKNNYSVFLAGGAVRDYLRGNIPSDFDIATNALPEEIKECFSDYEVIETGIAHGTVTVISDGEPTEITTFRIDGEYSDNRRPDEVRFTSSIEDDLSRRDFTINAMAYSEKHGLIDPFGGEKDLADGVIRCVGNPDKRFREDALRILRALRFSSVLDFSIDDATVRAIHENKDLLSNISAERIFTELEKLLCGEGCTRILRDYSDVIGVIIPEILPCVGFDQHNPYHRYDVWEHTCVATGNSRKDRIVRLALLFHDIEKPSCLVIDEKGTGHFHGHSIKSAETAENILRRLRCDTKTIGTVTMLISRHYDKPWIVSGKTDRKEIRRAMSETGYENFMRLVDIQYADDTAKSERAEKRLALHEKVSEIAEEIEKSGECYSLPQLKINGNDVSAAGFSGKAIGEKLREILLLVIEEKIPNEREKLLFYLTNG